MIPPPLRALPPAIQRWAAMVASLFGAGGAWARRVAVALCHTLLRRLFRMEAVVATDHEASIPQGGLTDPYTERGAPAASAAAPGANTTPPADGGGATLSLVANDLEALIPQGGLTDPYAERGAPAASAAAPGANTTPPADGGGATLSQVANAYGAAAPQETYTPVAKKMAPVAKKSPPGAKKSAPGAKKTNVPRPKNLDDPFGEGGYDLDALFSEDLEVDDVEMAYAMYCLARSDKIKSKRYELCDICFFHLKLVHSELKEKLIGHCKNVHGVEGHPCHKTGCYVRCRSPGEAGLHSLYLHEQKCKFWWRRVLESRGMRME